ncbi:MAG: ferredoxin [Flavobacteriia bacterium]|nr:ferredoxin [Flavobacteriia bacterium]
MIKVLQLRHKCIGCNACVEADKYRWRMSKKDGKSTLIAGKEKKGWFIAVVEDEEENRLETAKKHCPVNIIRWEKV